MASPSLKAVIGRKAALSRAITGVLDAMGGGFRIEDAANQPLLGDGNPGAVRLPVIAGGATLGWVSGPEASATAVAAALLSQICTQEGERRALAAEVLHLYREIHLIEQLSEQLAALLDFSAVGNAALQQAQRLISASHGVVLVLDADGGGFRPVARFGDGDAPHVDALIASMLDRGVAEIAAGQDCSLMGAPLRAKQRTAGAIVLANAGGLAYTAGDLKLLNTIALQTAAAIENAILCGEMVTAARDRENLAAIHKELETARTIQHSLVPRTFPPFPGRTDLDVYAQMVSAKAVGGDFFDFFLMDDDRLGVVIGDVSGKGIPSALFMAVTRTHIKTTALAGMSPALCLQEVNRVLVRDKASSLYSTGFYGILNARTGALEYCNAGHNPPYVVRADGQVESVTGASNLPLGLFAAAPYSGDTMQLNPGDALYLYTDGVTEATDAAENEYSNERLETCLRGTAPLPCRDLVAQVAHHLAAFTAGAPQSDDITMLAVRRC